MDDKPLFLLIAATITGAISLADIDLILAIVLKLIAIISFVISLIITIATKWEPAKNQIKKWFK